MHCVAVECRDVRLSCVIVVPGWRTSLPAATSCCRCVDSRRTAWRSWAAVLERGYEGWVGKDEASPYRGGITRSWLKVKVPGWTDAEDRWQRQLTARRDDRHVGVPPTTARMVPAIRCMATAPLMPSSLGRVLVVDDEPAVGATLREVLVELGYIVKLAVGGAEALKLVPVFEPDVVLLDLQMPAMSEVEVLDHLRRDHPTLRVVILTGNEDVEVGRATLRAGAFDYLSKPFSIDVLARVVAAAVGLPT
jgi:CheY-like chemotaxis protein